MRRIIGRLLVLSASVLLSAGPLWASGRAEGEGASVLVNSGHKGSILAMEFDEGANTLLTAGEDGTVRVWDMAARRLVRSLRIGHGAVSLLAVRPSTSQAAVFTSEDGLKARFLAVWDWKTGAEVFRIALSEEPLFLRYSAGGKYLMAGLSQWNGFKIFNASDGTPFSFHPEGFGIVSFAEISRTEKTIMTYQPGGRITYWDLGTGGIIKDMKGVTPVSRPAITRDKRYLFGAAASGELLLIDLVTGAVKTRIPGAGAVSADASALGDQIAWTAAPGANAVSFADMTKNPPVVQTIPGIPAVLIRYAGGELLAATMDGGIYSISGNDKPAALGKNELADVSGMAFGPGGLAVASDRWIWLFRSEGDQVRQPVIFENPFHAQAGLSFLDDGRLLIWSKGTERGAYGIMDAAAGSFKAGQSVSLGPLLQAGMKDGELLLLEKGGTVKIVDLGSGAVRFSTWSPGAARICMPSQTRLVAGRTMSGGSEGSILSIDVATGETVPIRDSSLYTYDLLFDARSGILYSLGVDGAGKTKLLAHSGVDFGTEAELASYAGEDFSATLALDPDTGRLYTSLGYSGITAVDGKALSSIPEADQVPRILAVSRGLLAVQNEDSSLSIRDLSRGGKTVFSAYVFVDGGWCLAFPGGSFAASDSAAGLVSVYDKGEPVSSDQFRIALQ